MVSPLQHFSHPPPARLKVGFLHCRLFAQLTGLAVAEKVDRTDRGEILVGDWWLSSAGSLTHVHPLYLSLCPSRCPSAAPRSPPLAPWPPDVHPQCAPVHPLRPLKEPRGQSSSSEGENASLLGPVCSRLPLCLGVIKQPSSAPRYTNPPPHPHPHPLPSLHPQGDTPPGRVSSLFHCTPSLAEDLLPVYSLFKIPSFVPSLFLLLHYHACALLFLITLTHFLVPRPLLSLLFLPIFMSARLFLPISSFPLSFKKNL